MDNISPPRVELQDVRFEYAGGFPALDRLSIAMPAGKLTAVVGPSGCGKTTLLRLLAGLLPRAGDVLVGEVIVVGSQRPPCVGLLHQEPALMRHRTVEENVRFLTEMRNPTEELGPFDVSELLRLVALTAHRHKYPDQLSVGMKNRVAVARTLAIGPELLLLDEPFAALDLPTRLPIYDAIAGFRTRGCTTTVLVTHDVQEAVLLAERVVVLTHNGRVLENMDISGDKPSGCSPSEVLGHSSQVSDLVGRLQGLLIASANAGR